MKQFKKVPVCEHCNCTPATHFILVGEDNDWAFYCDKCSVEYGDYPIEILDFFKKPAATVDWLAHLHGKVWINWNNFMEMMFRFREATHSYSV